MSKLPSKTDFAIPRRHGWAPSCSFTVSQPQGEGEERQSWSLELSTLMTVHSAFGMLLKPQVATLSPIVGPSGVYKPMAAHTAASDCHQYVYPG